MKLTRVYRMKKGNKTGQGQPRWVQVDARYYMAWEPKEDRLWWTAPYTKYMLMHEELRPKILAHFSGLDKDT